MIFFGEFNKFHFVERALRDTPRRSHSKFPKQSRPHQELQQRATEQSADNDGGDRVENFLAGFAGGKCQRHQTDA